MVFVEWVSRHAVLDSRSLRDRAHCQGLPNVSPVTTTWTDQEREVEDMKKEPGEQPCIESINH